MTQDEILEMAKQADVWVAGQEPYQSQLEAFAKLVAAKEADRIADEAKDIIKRAEERGAAKEREACAKLCDELQAPPHVSNDDMSMWDVTSMECADAIRARTQVDGGKV